MSAAAIGDWVGHYRLQEKIAEGGMAHLYLASAAGIRPPVALKVLREELASDPDIRARFAHEAMLGRMLHDPALPEVLYSDVSAERPYMALRLIEGQDLLQLLGRSPRLDLPTALALTLGTLEALQRLHNARDLDGASIALCHGDVAPDNVMLDREGKLHLVDLSMATSRLMPARWWQFGGKAAWSAPERVQGRAATVASDLYGVGACLFYALAGVRLNDASLSVLPLNRPELPKAVLMLVEELCRQSATERPSCAARVAERVIELLGDADPAALVGELWLSAAQTSPDAGAHRDAPTRPQLPTRRRRNKRSRVAA